ncbi:thyroid transcription factor 1-associated protein 26 homolog [Salarias fasciatus]|uniref:Coiled-coil domain containing 59 n=1 Tax=Salarias fasciatus TaxID=181472 RepID=A0A672HHF3_SALFA|nr:thyroid transcription factor 1-associated protein 26 [Salarias fasciatus]XP_029969431.1 thyroid transcription factor 1-associated protein 26 [Salarias fasciatus]
MAPTDQKRTNKKFIGKGGNAKGSKNAPHGVQKKRKWVDQDKVFQGSVKEGQGFAFLKKEKARHEYNKLLRKEKRNKKNPESKQLYAEEYPEHLRHLYLAEAEKLKNEAWANKVNRRKQRMKQQVTDAAEEDDAAETQQTEGAEEEVTGGSEPADSVSGSQEPEPAEATVRESLPMSNRMKKKVDKKTSFQKTKEEFERIKEKRRKKKEEYLKNKQQREEAIQRYKQKKMETFQMLSKKTKKGQPNLNLQMEYLLQKIQKN